MCLHCTEGTQNPAPVSVVKEELKEAPLPAAGGGVALAVESVDVAAKDTKKDDEGQDAKKNADTAEDAKDGKKELGEKIEERSDGSAAATVAKGADAVAGSKKGFKALFPKIQERIDGSAAATVAKGADAVEDAKEGKKELAGLAPPTKAIAIDVEDPCTTLISLMRKNKSMLPAIADISNVAVFSQISSKLESLLQMECTETILSTHKDYEAKIKNVGRLVVGLSQSITDMKRNITNCKRKGDREKKKDAMDQDKKALLAANKKAADTAAQVRAQQQRKLQASIGWNQ